jgi:hypothetical protein
MMRLHCTGIAASRGRPIPAGSHKLATHTPGARRFLLPHPPAPCSRFRPQPRTFYNSHALAGVMPVHPPAAAACPRSTILLLIQRPSRVALAAAMPRKLLTLSRSQALVTAPCFVIALLLLLLLLLLLPPPLLLLPPLLITPLDLCSASSVIDGPCT